MEARKVDIAETIPASRKLQRDDAKEPRAYKLPWSDEMARQLHESQRAAERDGSDVKVRMRRAQELIEGERMFYAKPREAPPPKQVASESSN